MPTAKQRHASLHAASKATPPRREAGEKTRTKRSIQTSSMPRQRRGPRPQGRAARQLASVCRQSASANRLAPTPVPQRPRSFSKTAANRSVQERILSNAGPLSVRAGRKILNPADFLPVMLRSGKRSDAAPAAKQAKKRGRNARFKLLPCRAKGAAPVRKDGRHGNWHPSAAKAPAPTASPRRLCLKGRAAFQKLPPIAAYRNAFCRMLARSL